MILFINTYFPPCLTWDYLLPSQGSTWNLTTGQVTYLSIFVKWNSHYFVVSEFCAEPCDCILCTSFLLLIIDQIIKNRMREEENPLISYIWLHQDSFNSILQCRNRLSELFSISFRPGQGTEIADYFCCDLKEWKPLVQWWLICKVPQDSIISVVFLKIHLKPLGKHRLV